VKIYFCDICNQSIPLQDLDSGTAVAVKGKLLCAQCNAAVAAAASKGGTSPAAAAAGGARGLGLGVTIVVALLAAAVAVGFVETRGRSQREAMRTEYTASLQTTRDVAQRTEQSLVDLREEIGGLGKKVEGLQGDSRVAREEDAGRLQHEVAELMSRLDKIKGYVEENEKLKETLQQLEIRIAANHETMTGLRREIDGLRTAMAEAPARAPAGPGEVKPAAALPESAPAGDSMAALPLELQRQIKLMQSTDAGKRWEAVGELGRSADPRVIAFLIPMLRDKDAFVRHHAAEVLGELDAKPAVMPLIEALGDDEPFVRDMVYTQLRKITRKSLKFDSSAKKEERDKQQRAWRAWAEQQANEKGVGNG